MMKATMRAFPSGAKALILADSIGTAGEVAEKVPASEF
jgi:hypothetical protein